MKELHSWFRDVQRPFPWREERTPYRVWISEVMLQQTRASVVVPYFEKWIQQFPDVFALAAAPEEVVIKAWEGLGYYSRARNIHRAAKEIVRRFGGEIPDSKECLETLPGLGPYTVGAILAFGFQKRAPAVDGNVLRVLSRYRLIEEPIDLPRVKEKIEREAEGLLHFQEPWVTAEALIELGATVCTPIPRCNLCPLASSCRALLSDRVADLPRKRPREATIPLSRLAVLIEAKGKVLLKKGQKGEIMADLYELPYWEGGRMGRTEVEREAQCRLGIEARHVKSLPRVMHHFTKYRVSLFSHVLQANEWKEVKGYVWVERGHLASLPFSSGHRRVIQAWSEQ